MGNIFGFCEKTCHACKECVEPDHAPYDDTFDLILPEPVLRNKYNIPEIESKMKYIEDMYGIKVLNKLNNYLSKFPSDIVRVELLDAVYNSAINGIPHSIISGIQDKINKRNEIYNKYKNNGINNLFSSAELTKAINLHQLTNLNEGFGHSSHVAKLRRS